MHHITTMEKFSVYSMQIQNKTEFGKHYTAGGLQEVTKRSVFNSCALSHFQPMDSNYDPVSIVLQPVQV